MAINLRKSDMCCSKIPEHSQRLKYQASKNYTSFANISVYNKHNIIVSSWSYRYIFILTSKDK